MQTLASIVFAGLFVVSIPLSLACCMSGIGLLEKRGLPLLGHSLLFFAASTSPFVFLAASVECLVWGSYNSVYALISYAAMALSGVAIDNEV